MLRGIYAPTDFKSVNQDPSIPAAQKLEIIAGSPVIVKQSVVREKSFWLTLPFVTGIHPHYGLGEDNSVLYTEYVNVGDKELYGHGIGSRLLRATCRFAVEREPSTRTFEINGARLGLLNTVVKVLGVENVAVRHYGERYGWQGQKPLDAVFDDYPPVPGDAYRLYAIDARIDADQAMEWEKPIYTQP